MERNHNDTDKHNTFETQTNTSEIEVIQDEYNDEADIVDESESESECENEEASEEVNMIVQLILNGCPLAEIKKYLATNLSIDLNSCINFWTPLHYATVANRADICELLVKNGSNVNFLAKTTHISQQNFLCCGSTPFVISCTRLVSLEIFALFLQNGGEVNSVEPDSGRGPFTYLVSEPNTDENNFSVEMQSDKLTMLIKYGGNLNIKDYFGRNVLHFIDMYTENEREENIILDMMKKCIQSGVDSDARDSWGYTPILIASQSLRPKRIKLLLQNGAAVSTIIVRDGSSLIHSLRYLNDLEMVSNYYERFEESLYLITGSGLNINSQTFIGETIIHELLNGDYNASVVEKVIHHGADIHQKNCYGYTPLHIALSYKQGSLRPKSHQAIRIDISQMLIAHTADIHTRDVNQMTILMSAIRKNCLENVAFILDRCDASMFDARDKFECTALHHCVFAAFETEKYEGKEKIEEIKSNKEILRMILKAGITSRVEDIYSNEAGYYAQFLDEEIGQYYGQKLCHSKEKLSSSSNTWISYQQKIKVLKKLFNVSNSNYILENKNTILREMIEFPGIGSVNYIPESSIIMAKVDSLLDEFSRTLTIKDLFNLKYSYSISGGVAEGTKVGLPDEYDYLIFIENLSDQLIPEVHEDTKLGYIMMKYIANSKNEKFSSHGYFDTSKFTCYFYKLAMNLLSSLAFWKDANFYWLPNPCDTDDESERLENSANLLISLEYLSQNYGKVNITIDVVPVIKLPSDWRHTIDNSSTLLVSSDCLCATLMKPAGDHEMDVLQMRISTSLIETRIISSLPNHIKNAYILLKAIKDICVFQFEEYSMDYKLSYFINTYLIKNALLKYYQSSNHEIVNSLEEYNNVECVATLDSAIQIISNIDAKSCFFAEMDLRNSIHESIERRERENILENLKLFLLAN